MLETLIILCILLAFIFPLHFIAITLGAGTTWLIYRGNLFLKRQPKEGQPIIWISLMATAANFLMSLFVGGVMASLVFYIIYDNYYLFLFNFAFCSIISLRWFGFSHKRYMAQVLKIKTRSAVPATFKEVNGQGEDPVQRLFAMCIGLGKKTGMGLGMVPIFLSGSFTTSTTCMISQATTR